MRCEGIAAETAPGDGDAVCGEMNDATNVRVLLDSWRYQTLLPRNMSTTNTAVWTTFSTPVGGNDVVSRSDTLASLLQCSDFCYSGLQQTGCVKVVQLQLVQEVKGASCYSLKPSVKVYQLLTSIQSEYL